MIHDPALRSISGFRGGQRGHHLWKMGSHIHLASCNAVITIVDVRRLYFTHIARDCVFIHIFSLNFPH